MADQDRMFVDNQRDTSDTTTNASEETRSRRGIVAHSRRKQASYQRVYTQIRQWRTGVWWRSEIGFGVPPHILVIVKVPDPEHPPVKIHVPVTVLLFTVPVRVRVLPGGVPDTMVNWKAPVILPLRSPLSTNDPVSVPPEVKQSVEVVKVRFVPVTTVVVLACVSDVVNVKAGVVSGFVSVAVQLPATVAAVFEFPPPHAQSVTPNARTAAIPNCLITAP
jgi:hypothetical protein